MYPFSTHAASRRAFTAGMTDDRRTYGLKQWTDARRPVPRLWIRSAEERGERRYENRNTTTTTVTADTLNVSIL